MEILSRIRGLADLDVVSRRQLQKAFDSRAGMLRSLAFISVRQKQNQARQQSPFVLAGTHKLVDDGLRDVGEVAELRLPEYERLGIITAVAVFESHDTGFGERRIVDIAGRLSVDDMPQWNIFGFVLGVDQYGMPLVEGRATGILTAQPDRNPLLHQAGEG